jgi:hypothetical protein
MAADKFEEFKLLPPTRPQHAQIGHFVESSLHLRDRLEGRGRIFRSGDLGDGADMETKFLRCAGCGRIHLGITKAAAATEVRLFNKYLAGLSPEDRQSGYGDQQASIERCKKCHYCGTSSAAFVPAVGHENSGVTMQVVILPRQEKCDQ